MKTLSLFVAAALFLGMALTQDGHVLQPTYIGSQACIGCHSSVMGSLSFDSNDIADYQKTGHPFKLNAVSGAAPMYPENTSPGVKLPPGTTWDDFQYVIGGYGWKARFVRPDGRVYTVGDSAQYNLGRGDIDDLLLNESWAPYNKDQEVLYNYSCFRCHTTGPSTDGSWNNVPADNLGTFREPGIRCEACHGPGSEHRDGAFMGVDPPITGDSLRIAQCGECHQRGGKTNAIPASGGYVRHHEQLNEMRAAKHGDGLGAELTCASCHNPHAPVRYRDEVTSNKPGISTECQDCHGSQQVLLNGSPKPIDCIDCHMPRASKSAVGVQAGNGWIGDVRTHIWGINTGPFTKTEAMFTPDGARVALDGNGLAAVTLDFACLGCHTDKTVQWAANYASAVHSGIVTGTDDIAGVPESFVLEQNYPNPFNPTTTIEFSVPEPAQVSIRLYTATGRLVGTLYENYMPPGYHSVSIDARSLASGVYFYEMKAGDFVATKSMVLQK